MARPPTAQVVERDGKRGRTFAIRFRAYRERPCLRTSAATREEAERAPRHVLADVERGIWQPPRAVAVAPEGVPLFWDLARRWYDQREGEVAERTREHWQYLLNSHLIYFGTYPVDAITEE